MASLAGGNEPHFTYIADFIHRFEIQIKHVFKEVLLICWELGLIGGEFLAMDGCKLPSNAAKERSGKFSDLKKKEEKIRKTLDFLIEKHNRSDKETFRSKTSKDRFEKIEAKANKIKEFLETHDPKFGPRKNEIQSNITDNESARMKSSHGMIQGYNGLALVDAKTQIIVHAETHGGNNESQFTQEFLENTKTVLAEKEIPEELLTGSTLIADTGFFSEDNLKFLDDENINAIIPDTNFRKRDPRFATMDRHRDDGSMRRFILEDFTYDKDENFYTCPSFKQLIFKGRHKVGNITGDKYQAKASDCSGCTLRSQCLKTEVTKFRTLYVAVPTFNRNYSKEMMDKIDSPEGRDIYAKRMGIVEPVFGNIRACKGMDRFNYRGKRKVNIQWLLYCMVHNIGKISVAMRN